jgi:hypothetical protein
LQDATITRDKRGHEAQTVAALGWRGRLQLDWPPDYVESVVEQCRSWVHHKAH